MELPSGLIEISRSYSYKLNVEAHGGTRYESRDFFCAAKTECPAEKAEEIASVLHAFCKKNVLVSVSEEIAGIAKRPEESYHENMSPDADGDFKPPPPFVVYTEPAIEAPLVALEAMGGAEEVANVSAVPIENKEEKKKANRFKKKDVPPTPEQAKEKLVESVKNMPVELSQMERWAEIEKVILKKDLIIFLTAFLQKPLAKRPDPIYNEVVPILEQISKVGGLIPALTVEDQGRLAGEGWRRLVPYLEGNQYSKKLTDLAIEKYPFNPGLMVDYIEEHGINDLIKEEKV